MIKMLRWLRCKNLRTGSLIMILIAVSQSLLVLFLFHLNSSEQQQGAGILSGASAPKKVNDPRESPLTYNASIPALARKLAFQRGNASHPRIAYVTFSHLLSTTRFEELIFPAVDFWVPPEEPYFVVLARKWKETFHELVKTNENFTRYKSRLHPIFANCEEGKEPQNVCCKQEYGLLYMMENYDYDWVVYLDDDNFVRSENMRTFLSNVSTNELMVLTSSDWTKLLGQYGYLRQKSPYKCSDNRNFTFPWGQMVAYNRRTLQHLRRGLQLNGLVKQCVEYDLFHDAGNALFHWMYQLPELRLHIADRFGYILNDPNRGSYLGVHGVGRCRFPCLMNDIAEKLNSSQFDLPYNIIKVWRNEGVSGFQKTATFQTHGDPSQWKDTWHTMPREDCLGLPSL